MLTTEPEMLQPGAFCEHTMQQNATADAAGGAYNTPSDSQAGFKGAALRWGGEVDSRRAVGTGPPIG